MPILRQKWVGLDGALWDGWGTELGASHVTPGNGLFAFSWFKVEQYLIKCLLSLFNWIPFLCLNNNLC